METMSVNCSRNRSLPVISFNPSHVQEVAMFPEHYVIIILILANRHSVHLLLRLLLSLQLLPLQRSGLLNQIRRGCECIGSHRENI